MKGSLIGTKLQFTVKKGQFLLSKIDARLGAFGIVPDILDGGIITGNFWAFDVDKKKVNIEWFNLFTSSGNFYEICNKASSGTTHRKYLDETKFLNFEIDLPDIDEQNEFIIKYNEYRNKFYYLENEINHQQTYLQQLRQSILQEAVQGKLTQQNPTDEPASKLLERIKAEKQQLIATGKLKNEKPLPPITAAEIPFELPKGWEWCRLKELGYVTGGGTPSTNKTEYWNGDIPWITPKDMKADYLNNSEDKVTSEGVNNSSAKLIPANSVLIVGRSGILKRTLPVCINTVECTVNQDLKVIVPYLSDMARYIQLMLQGHEEFILKNLVKYGMTVHSLMYQEFELQILPLPPLPEQQRIVAKVQQLMQMVNQLELQVQESQTQAQQLLQAVLKEAFNSNAKAYEENELITLAAEE